MKDFILKKSSLILLILSSLLLLTLVFNYLSEGGSSDIMIRGYEALFGTTVVDNIVTIKVEFNLFLIMIVLLPFILSLIALIYEKKYN
ncbi:MAG TPA: hypothetical protein VJ878_00860, partial [Candidatus Izemoplasmatales bacterium]|nr:hypothetical protein [Candidatus Izemoplasmatales bacterium]